MKKLKKILVFLVLVVGCCCCFCSCSCSSKNPTEPTSPPPAETPSTGGIQEATYYDVSVNVIGDSGAGGYVSSTGSNKHLSASSPVYTFTPNVGYAIETITIDGAVYFTHLAGAGYKKEPMQVTLQNISKNYTMGVTFKHMDYVVECNISGELLGGTIVSSTGDDTHKGATSPTYTVTPQEGYVISHLEVDGVKIYDYQTDYVSNKDGATAVYTISEQFEIINDNHSINATFLKLFDVQNLNIDAKYYQNYRKSSQLLVDDTTNLIFTNFDAVTFEGVDDYDKLPLGMKHRFKLNMNSRANDYFSNMILKVSIDGGATYSSEFGLDSNFEDQARGFKFFADSCEFEVDNFSENFVLETIAIPKSIVLKMYDHDKETTTGTINTYLFSYKERINNSLYWYRSITNDYHLTNQYVDISEDIEMFETSDGEEIYRIYLDESMLIYGSDDSLLAQVVLIYSTTAQEN